LKYTLLAIVLWLSAGQASGSSPTGSLQVTTPQRYSLSLGYSSADWGLFGSSGGYVIRIEPGLSGGKVHLGLRGIFNLSLLPVMSAEITGSLLQTWNDPWGGIPGGQTFAGGELRLGLRLITATAGLYRHAAGDDTDHDWITSLGVGLGL